MHPAFSVLFFTTFSGAGYGLLTWLCLGLLPANGTVGFFAMGLAVSMIVFGLLCSTLHLGHPERAIKALSQWRTSWLSREGVLAIAAFLPMALFGFTWVVTGSYNWLWALISGVFALITVFSTAMIYNSLKPIRHWNHPLVPILYLGFALATGAVWHVMLALMTGSFSKAMGLITIGLLLGVWLIKWLYWKQVDEGKSSSTAGTATGLGHLGKVTLLDSPHTEENYLQKEMGYVVARKHAKLIRMWAFILAGLIPAITVLIAVLLKGGAIAAFLVTLSAIIMMVGMIAERWLFFAQAKHTVTLYYGAQTA